jgi:hypothetical protein
LVGGDVGDGVGCERGGCREGSWLLQSFRGVRQRWEELQRRGTPSMKRRRLVMPKHNSSPRLVPRPSSVVPIPSVERPPVIALQASTLITTSWRALDITYHSSGNQAVKGALVSREDAP